MIGNNRLNIFKFFIGCINYYSRNFIAAGSNRQSIKLPRTLIKAINRGLHKLLNGHNKFFLNIY